MPTPLCRRLGIRVPSVQAPMNWATDARLVAAVSEAGGLGVLGPNAGDEPPAIGAADVGERLRRRIRRIRTLTKYMGAGAGLIRDILTCAQVIEQTMREARHAVEWTRRVFEALPERDGATAAVGSS
ncbi:MAG: nitronate monooxygenase [Casimicrobiaceae bacterium]